MSKTANLNYLKKLKRNPLRIFRFLRGSFNLVTFSGNKSYLQA
ncbi:hypothetical protein PLO_1985 [Pediococcus acidilactici NGRI 0510Q]|nr:hypothetical protein PLO_1985 [Pediococcus acidilactici NGRI 0510Q]